MLANRLSERDWLAIEREACKRSLSTFVQESWHVIEPGIPYVHNWHVDAVSEHLEAVTSGEITRLLINIPPGTMKSSLTAVFWPAWEWGPRALPHMRVIGASHEAGLATRDTLKMRRLVTSDWFQKRWPTRLTGDQNQKTYYENDRTGFRQACAVASMTGRRGDRVVWDDPHSVEASLSPTARAVALRVFQETLPTRLNIPERSAIIIVMQRLHENDVTGYALDNDLGYEHLMLPMEYDPKRSKVTCIGFKDPRTQEGELLFPERFPREVVDRDKKVMGKYAVAGQFQQEPAPRTGAFFEWEKLEIVRSVPRMAKSVIRYWDKAGTEDGGAYTAGVKMGLGVDGVYYILDVVRGQWGAPKRNATMKQTAGIDGVDVHVWVEQEPGSGGKESAEITIKDFAGYTIKKERATGDKVVRADPYSIQVEAGNVRLLAGDWNKAFIDEHKVFPVGKYKDQIDATSGAFNKLALGSSYNLDNVG